LFPTSRLWEIYSELIEYALKIQMNAPTAAIPESESENNEVLDEEYENLMTKFADIVNNFGGMINELERYNSQKRSNYNPNYSNDNIPSEENVKSYEDTLK